MPDGLVHVVQNGRDRAFDPVDGHEVSLEDDTNAQLLPEEWIEEQIAEMEKKKKEREIAEEKKKNQPIPKKINPFDGLIHVTQNGKDRAFDPTTMKEVDLNPIDIE